MNTRIVSLLLIIFVWGTHLHSASFKKYAGEFMNLGVGSSALGMAGAYTALTSDVTSGYWNPAGLVKARGFQMSFMHSKQFISSIQHNYLAVSHPMEDRSALALSVTYLTVNGIKDSRQAKVIADGQQEGDYSLDYSKIRTFNTGDYVVYLSYAKAYNERLHYGASAKVIYRDYNIESAMGIGFDVGFQYNIWRNLHSGLMLRDITSTLMSWSSGETELIAPSVRLGLAYIFQVPAVPLRIKPAMDFNILNENRAYASQYHLGSLSLDSFWGMEISYKNTLALRFGMDDLNRFNTGIGLQIPKMRFDYSFTAYESELGDIHRISFHLQLPELYGN